MKFTFALFNTNKRKSVGNKYISIKDKELIKKKSKKINNNRKTSKLPFATIFFILSLLFNIKVNSIFLASNIFSYNFGLLKNTIFSQNLLANSSCYNFSKEDNNSKNNIVVIDSSDGEKAIDSVIYENSNSVNVFKNIDTSDITEISENNNYQKLNICGIDVTNYSSNRNIDYKKILEIEDKYFNSDDEIAIYTTHTSESYANSDEYKFDYSSPARTLDGRYNMLSIASSFSKNLNLKGINTICSLNPHDYGEYNSAYTNSRMTLSQIIQNNPNVKIAIDVHRDAIEDLSFAPKVNIKGYNVACIMLVMGIGYEDCQNPYYEQNLKLAFELQMLGEKIYPGLFRPMIIRNSVYNQDLMANSFLVEVGATGNTIEESKLATRCLSNLLNIIYNH